MKNCKRLLNANYLEIYAYIKPKAVKKIILLFESHGKKKIMKVLGHESKLRTAVYSRIDTF